MCDSLRSGLIRQCQAPYKIDLRPKSQKGWQGFLIILTRRQICNLLVSKQYQNSHIQLLTTDSKSEILRLYGKKSPNTKRTLTSLEGKFKTRLKTNHLYELT